MPEGSIRKKSEEIEKLLEEVADTIASARESIDKCLKGIDRVSRNECQFCSIEIDIDLIDGRCPYCGEIVKRE